MYKRQAQEIEGQDAKITQGELWLLRRDAYKLQCLENAGVDNTQAYEEGMREFHPVSYTHLDVYKRQGIPFYHRL